jgi:hypothetical protein
MDFSCKADILAAWQRLDKNLALAASTSGENAGSVTEARRVHGKPISRNPTLEVASPH